MPDEVCKMDGNQILDEVGEREEVDIVKDQIRGKHDKVGEGGVWRNPVRGGCVDHQRRKSAHPCRLSAVSRGQ